MRTPGNYFDAREHVQAVQSRLGVNRPSEEQLAALVAYAKAHGRKWKSQLNHAWMTGQYGMSDDSMNLQQVRNTLGPTWLIRFRLPSGIPTSGRRKL